MQSGDTVTLDGVPHTLEISDFAAAAGGRIATLTVIGRRGRPTKAYRLARLVGDDLVEISGVKRWP